MNSMKRKRGRPPKLADELGKTSSESASKSSSSVGGSSDGDPQYVPEGGEAPNDSGDGLDAGEYEPFEADFADEGERGRRPNGAAAMPRSVDEPVLLVRLPVFLERDYPHYHRALQVRGNVENWVLHEVMSLEAELRQMQDLLWNTSKVLRVENAKMQLWPSQHPGADVYVSDVAPYREAVVRDAVPPRPYATQVLSKDARGSHRNSLLDVVTEARVDPWATQTSKAVVGFRCGIALAELGVDPATLYNMDEGEDERAEEKTHSPVAAEGPSATAPFASTVEEMSLGLPIPSGMVRSMSEVQFETLRKTFAVNGTTAHTNANNSGGNSSAVRKRKKKDRESEPVLLRSKRQPTAHPFWKSVEGYFRDISKEDMLLLQEEYEKSNDAIWTIPKLGPHFAEIWEKEDEMAHSVRHGAKRPKVSSSSWLVDEDPAGHSQDLDYDLKSRRKPALNARDTSPASAAVSQRRALYDADARAGRLRPEDSLMQRLVSSLVDVHVLPKDAAKPYPAANGEFELDYKTTALSGPFHSDPIWPAALPLVEGYDLDVKMELDTRLRAHMRAVGLLGEDPIDPREAEDDELCCTLRALQRKLREQILISNERKKRVRNLIIPYIKLQEDRKKIRERNAELERAYERVLRAQYHAKLAEESAQEALKQQP